MGDFANGAASRLPAEPWQTGGHSHAASQRHLHNWFWFVATQHAQSGPALALVVQITNLEVDQKAQARRGTAVSAVCDWRSNCGCKPRGSRRSASRSVVTVFQIWEYPEPMPSPPQQAQTTREACIWLRKA